MTDARDEAERRYPYPADAPFSAVRSDLNAARQSAFIAGAEWAREQPVRVTDDMVERAARAIMRAQGLGQFLSSTGVANLPIWLRAKCDARAALEAALDEPEPSPYGKGCNK